MNGKIGTVTITQESILAGDHSIITSVRLADGITSPKAGALLVYGAEGYTLGAAAAEAFDAVLLEDYDGDTSGTVLPVCIHGSVRAEKLLLGTAAATEADRPKLRLRGIYAVGNFAK